MLSFRIYISKLIKENRFSQKILQSPMILKSKDYLVWKDNIFISANVLNFCVASLTAMITTDSKFPLFIHLFR